MGNPIRSSADVQEPWARLEHNRADWEWRILKAYKQGNTSRKDEYSRFFCAVMSPHTYGSWEYGDVYVHELLRQLPGVEVVEETPEFREWMEEFINAS